MIRLFLLIVFLPLCAAAQDPPRGIKRSEPEYSEEARESRLNGTVTIQMLVGEDGIPRDSHVVKPLGLGLDEKALAAVANWRFKPGMKRGVATTDLLTFEMIFRVGIMSSWHLGSALCEPSYGASRPTVIHSSFPSDSPSPEKEVSVAVSFDVDEAGIPSNLHVERSSDGSREKEVIATMREWRFKPDLIYGPRPVRCTWEFVQSEAPTRPKIVPRRQ
jgi:TonB family protein